MNLQLYLFAFSRCAVATWQLPRHRQTNWNDCEFMLCDWQRVAAAVDVLVLLCGFTCLGAALRRGDDKWQWRYIFMGGVWQYVALYRAFTPGDGSLHTKRWKSLCRCSNFFFSPLIYILIHHFAQYVNDKFAKTIPTVPEISYLYVLPTYQPLLQ